MALVGGGGLEILVPRRARHSIGVWAGERWRNPHGSAVTVKSRCTCRTFVRAHALRLRASAASAHAGPHAVVVATLLELRSSHVAFRRFVWYMFIELLCVFTLTVLTLGPGLRLGPGGPASLYAVWTC